MKTSLNPLSPLNLFLTERLSQYLWSIHSTTVLYSSKLFKITGSPSFKVNCVFSVNTKNCCVSLWIHAVKRAPSSNLPKVTLYFYPPLSFIIFFHLIFKFSCYKYKCRLFTSDFLWMCVGVLCKKKVFMEGCGYNGKQQDISLNSSHIQGLTWMVKRGQLFSRLVRTHSLHICLLCC